MGNPLPVNLGQECRKAQKILSEFVDPAHGGLDRIIPLSVLKKAQGFAFFSVFRLGFLVSARAGSGVVIARLPDNSWSAPSALGIGGVGGGFNAGMDVTDFLIVLNSKQAVKSFMATGSLQLGGNLSVAVGPMGRSAEASGAVNSSGNVAAMFSYSKSKGLYGGVSVEGTILLDRSDANSKAYNRIVTAKQLLSGAIEAPSFAQPLISTIEKFTLTGDVARGIDAGRREDESQDAYYASSSYDDDDYSTNSDYRKKNDNGYGTRSEMEAIDREMSKARLSPSAGKGGFVDDFSSQRPGDYAFGSASGGSHTNSPTRTRKSFLGNSYSTANGTDYTYDDAGSKSVFDPTNGSSSKSSRVPFLRNRSSSNANTHANSTGSIFGDEAAIDYPVGSASGNNRSSPSWRADRGGKATAAFPTHFERGSEDESSVDANHNTSSVARDSIPFGKSRESWEEEESLRRAPHAALNRAGNNDLLDFELDRSAVTQRQAPRGQPEQRGGGDLIDLRQQLQSQQDETSPSSRFKASASSSAGSRKKGYDSLDRELQASRGSMSSNDSFVDHTDASPAWRNDFRQQQQQQDSFSGAAGARPKMHGRTSSAQKIMSRLRGNSQSSKSNNNAYGNGETWDQRYRTPSPVASRSGGTPTGFKSSGTPTGFRSSTTPTGFKSSSSNTNRSSTTTPTGFRSSSFSSTGFNPSTSASSASPTQALSRGTIKETDMTVIADYDFQGQEIDDLSFQRGDVIQVLKRTQNRDDWWFGKRGSKTGNFPANYTQDV